MATWMTHFRIADHFLDRIEGLSAREFIVGNIGPDCGEPNEDWSVFTPPSAITHWRDGSGNSLKDEFAKKYLCGQALSKHRSFYLGYYIHLITDIEWNHQIYLPKKALFAEEFEARKDFIWQFKRDWYDIDHLFYRENPTFRAFSQFSAIKDFRNEFLDYYSENAFQRQIDNISGFYKDFNGDLEHDYPYLNSDEMDGFVLAATASIGQALTGRKLLDSV